MRINIDIIVTQLLLCIFRRQQMARKYDNTKHGVESVI